MNGYLQEEYGLPTWGSYAIFTVATVFVGAALGLMLVCIVDFIYPPKKLHRQSFSEANENLRNDIEDIANDEIEDDRPKESETKEAIKENADDNENVSTEDEKHSQSVSEDEALEKKSEGSLADNKTSPVEMRKRRSRKAD